MAHYAKVEDGVVVEVLVVPDEFEDSGEEFLHSLGLDGRWVKTSYRTFENEHSGGGTALRGNFAGKGYTYDEEADVFVPPRPYPSWQLDENVSWQPPVPHPGGLFHWWNEESLEWLDMRHLQADLFAVAGPALVSGTLTDDDIERLARMRRVDPAMVAAALSDPSRLAQYHEASSDDLASGQDVAAPDVSSARADAEPEVDLVEVEPGRFLFNGNPVSAVLAAAIVAGGAAALRFGRRAAGPAEELTSAEGLTSGVEDEVTAGAVGDVSDEAGLRLLPERGEQGAAPSSAGADS